MILLLATVLAFKGIGEYLLSVWLLIPILFPLFPEVLFVTGRTGLSYVKMELILTEGGVIGAHSGVVLLFVDVIECVLSCKYM